MTQITCLREPAHSKRVIHKTRIPPKFLESSQSKLGNLYIHETSDLLASLTSGAASLQNNHLNTVLANAEWHFGNRYSATFGWFNTSGTVDPLLYAASPVSGSANGSPHSAGYIANFSYWPWQNLQLAAQYIGYTRFNGGSTNYDSSFRNANGNNTIYLDAKFLF